tara:strand:+ start:9812 stop:10603 length:792 start_codon:yes stop_codon:yes gene_type:complete
MERNVCKTLLESVYKSKINIDMNKEEKGNWQICKERSTYHFDPFDYNAPADRMRYVGKFTGDWTEELNTAIANAKSVSWRTRDPRDNPRGSTSGTDGIDKTELDIIRAGGKPDLEITSLEYVETYPSFQKMTDELHLLDGDRPLQSRIHVQMPGQTWTAHVDKLEKWCHEDPDKVYRFMIFLHDYEFGHFVQYGNEILTKYRAGEIYTWDHRNVPHCTANAGVTPRATMIVTGIGTSETEAMFSKSNLEIKINDKENKSSLVR